MNLLSVTVCPLTQQKQRQCTRCQTHTHPSLYIHTSSSIHTDKHILAQAHRTQSYIKSRIKEFYIINKKTVHTATTHSTTLLCSSTGDLVNWPLSVSISRGKCSDAQSSGINTWKIERRFLALVQIIMIHLSLEWIKASSLTLRAISYCCIQVLTPSTGRVLLHFCCNLKLPHLWGFVTIIHTLICPSHRVIRGDFFI